MTVGLLSFSTTSSWASVDGSLNSTSGSAPFPTLLNGLVARPPWSVAGVDYNIGYRNALSDPWPGYPSTGSGSFASLFLTQIGGFGNLSAGSNILTISNASGMTLSNWDFSLHGGVGVLLNTCTSPTVTDCNFKFSTNTGIDCLSIKNGTQNTIVEYCVLDNAGTSGLDAVIGMFSNPGVCINLTVQYCWIKNAGSDAISITDGTSFIQYNLFQDIGQQIGNHPDLVQHVDGSPRTGTDTITFNTLYQNANNIAVPTQGFAAAADNNVTATGSSFISNNTAFLSGSSVAVSSFISPMSNFSSGATVVINQNYINAADSSTNLNSFNYGGNVGLSQLFLTGNINMLTGGSIV